MKTAEEAAKLFRNELDKHPLFKYASDLRKGAMTCGFRMGFESQQGEVDKIKEVLEQCAEVLNLLASRAGICTEDAALKCDAEDFGALSALRAAREVLNQYK